MDASREPALWAVPTPAAADRQRQAGALLASVALHALLLWTDTRVAFTTSPPQTHAGGGAAWRVQRHTSPTSRAPGATNLSEPEHALADGAADPTTLRSEPAANVGGSALGATALGATDPGTTLPGAPTDASRTAGAASSTAPGRPPADAVDANAAKVQPTSPRPPVATPPPRAPTTPPPEPPTSAVAAYASPTPTSAVPAPTPVPASAQPQPQPQPQPAPPPVVEPTPDRKTAVVTEPGMAAPPDATDLIGAFDVDDPSMSARRGQRGNASMTGASSSVAQPDAPRLRAVGAPPPNPERTAQDDAPRATARPPTLETSSSPDHDEREATARADPRPETAAPSTASAMRPASLGAVGSTARAGRPGSAASASSPALLRATDGAWTPTLTRIVIAPWAAPYASMASVASADRAASSERAPATATTAATAASEGRRLATPKRPRAVASKLPRPRPTTEPTTDEADLAHDVETAAAEALAEPPREPLEDPVERLARIMGWQSAAPSAASDEGVAAVRAIVLPDAFNPDLQGGVKVRATPLGAYLAETDAEIEAEWLSHPVDPARATIARTVTLAFDIARSGRVDGLSIQASSGDTDLDLIALAAVPKRFKRIPRTIEAEPLHHVLTLRYLPSTGGVQAP